MDNMNDKLKINIDKTSSIPLYLQVEKELRSLIKSGSLKDLPRTITEKLLEEEFKVSRNTIRQAISKLVDEGLLIRRRARGISVVDDASKVMGETTDGLSFTEAAIKRGQKPTAKILISKEIPAPKDVREALSLGEGAKVFHSRRVRFLDGIPVSIANYYIPLEVAPGISEDDFSEDGPNQSVHYVLERFYDQQILKWVESVEAIAVSAEDAKILQIPEGSPVVLRTDVIYSTEGKNIAYNKIIMTANYRITGLVYKKERL